LVTAAAFAAAPALAQALPAPDDRPSSPKQFSNAQIAQQDRLGPKNVTAHFPSLSSNPAGQISRPGGFEWHEGSVISGIVALAIALVAAARMLRYRRRRGRIEQKGFASA
jgi:hypothetical protein